MPYYAHLDFSKLEKEELNEVVLMAMLNAPFLAFAQTDPFMKDNALPQEYLGLMNDRVMQLITA